MKKEIIKYTILGVLWGSFIISMINAIGSALIGSSWFAAMPYSYNANLLAGIITGIGWVLPTLIYNNEKLSLGIQTLFHLTIAFMIYIPCCFIMGWIPTDRGLGVIVTLLALILLASLLMWSAFYLYYRHEAKKMNQRIKEINRQ